MLLENCTSKNVREVINIEIKNVNGVITPVIVRNGIPTRLKVLTFNNHSGSPYPLQGVECSGDAEKMVIISEGVDDIVIKHNDQSIQADYRIFTESESDLTLSHLKTASFIYHSSDTSKGWFQLK